MINGQVRYSAVWQQPGNISEVQVYGWSYEDYRKKYDELWGQGWRLHILQPFVLNGTVLYSAVWRQMGNIPEIQLYGQSYEDFRRKYDELWNQGFRLQLIKPFKLADGALRYSVVFRQGNQGELQLYNWSYNDYRQWYDQNWGGNWRLMSLEAY